MANREGSAAAGRADRSLTLQSEGAGGAGEEPLPGREGTQTIRPGGHPKPSCLPTAAGFTPVGMGSSARLRFPVHPRDARGTKALPGAEPLWVLSLPQNLTWHRGVRGARPAVPRRGRQPRFPWAEQPGRHC